jgi:hypothetical protein
MFQRAAFVLIVCALFPALSVAKTDAPALDPAFCRALVKHVPDADVAYQPGIDVHGKPVAPADLLGTNNFQLPKTISIPLTADLMTVLNFPTSSFPFNTMTRNDIQLGTLMVDGERVLYNGQPLTDDQQDKLAVLCMKPQEQNRSDTPQLPLQLHK